MDQVLFCPFCGEAPEGVTHCPEHELALVSWQQLPSRRDALPETAALPWHFPCLGRAWLALGALLTLVAFATLSLARVDGAAKMGGSMLQLALTTTPKLWLVPMAALAQLLILHRRRSALALRSARLAAGFLACIPALAVYWTWHGAQEAIALLVQRMHQPMHMQMGAGLICITLGGALMLIGALRLGVMRSAPRD